MRDDIVHIARDACSLGLEVGAREGGVALRAHGRDGRAERAAVPDAPHELTEHPRQQGQDRPDAIAKEVRDEHRGVHASGVANA
ncbi:MAG: hypothetical protein ACJLS2_07550 [Microcella pacifica]